MTTQKGELLISTNFDTGMKVTHESPVSQQRVRVKS